jgi:hypothetical protein
MGRVLTAADLAAFLRNRQASDSRIAADWVADHPEHPAVAAELDRLESFCQDAADFVARSVPAAWLTRTSSERVLFVLQALTGGDRRPADADQKAWGSLVEESHAFIERRGPSWAGAIVRNLRRREHGQITH